MDDRFGKGKSVFYLLLRSSFARGDRQTNKQIDLFYFSLRRIFSLGGAAPTAESFTVVLITDSGLRARTKLSIFFGELSWPVLSESPSLIFEEEGRSAAIL